MIGKQLLQTGDRTHDITGSAPPPRQIAAGGQGGEVVRTQRSFVVGKQPLERVDRTRRVASFAPPVSQMSAATTPISMVNQIGMFCLPGTTRRPRAPMISALMMPETGRCSPQLFGEARCTR
jgi:hypothetical protein